MEKCYKIIIFLILKLLWLLIQLIRIFSVAYLHQGGRDGRGMWRGQGKREMHVKFDMKN